MPSLALFSPFQKSEPAWPGPDCVADASGLKQGGTALVQHPVAVASDVLQGSRLPAGL
jgi:hypothetical protein